MNTVLKSILVFAFIFSLNAVNAGNAPFNGNNTSDEIKTLLEGNFNKTLVKEPTTVKVAFVITSSNELVVLHTDNSQYDDKIKDVLNYKKLNSRDLKIGKTYIIPVEIVGK